MSISITQKTKDALLSALGQPEMRDEVIGALTHAAYGFDTDTNLIEQGMLAQDVIRYADTTIAHAAILTLGTVPVTLVAAPGTGYFIDPISYVVYYDYNTAGYTLSTETVDVEYGSNATVLAAVMSNAELVGSADVRKNMRQTVATLAPVENSKLQLTTSGNTDPGGGNAASSIKVRVYYRIVPFSL